MTTPNRKRPGKAPLIFVTVAIALTAVCLMSVLAVAFTADRKPDGSSTRQPIAGASTSVTTSVPAAPAPAQSAAPPSPVVPTIDEGTFTIPDDFPAGTYEAKGAEKTCYWAIYKTGTNQDFGSIVSNHIGGGNLRVVLKAGQDFQTNRCPSWIKVK